jgi:hypothetical protein
MKLFEVIREAGEGEIVAALAAEAGVERAQAEAALRALLPALGRAIRARGEGGAGMAAVDAALRDERYARYLDDPAALGEPAAASAGERVLAELLDRGERDPLVRRAAAATGQSEADLRQLLPLVATVAIAAVGRNLRGSSPAIPWFGTRPGDQFSAPLLNALASLFEHADQKPSQGG